MSSMSGTTRDAIDTDLTTPDGRTFKLIDTAGIRRRTAVAGAPQGPTGFLRVLGVNLNDLRVSSMVLFLEDVRFPTSIVWVL